MNRDEILKGDVRPSLKPIDADRIPEAMRSAPRWLAWNFRNRDGRWTKVPVGKSNAPATWSAFEPIIESYLAGGCDGIGFALGDGWAGVDLDACLGSENELTPLVSKAPPGFAQARRHIRDRKLLPRMKRVLPVR